MHDIWKDMFVMGLPLLEKVLRPIIVYAFLVVSLRLSGKREPDPDRTVQRVGVVARHVAEPGQRQ